VQAASAEIRILRPGHRRRSDPRARRPRWSRNDRNLPPQYEPSDARPGALWLSAVGSPGCHAHGRVSVRTAIGISIQGAAALGLQLPHRRRGPRGELRRHCIARTPCRYPAAASIRVQAVLELALRRLHTPRCNWPFAKPATTDGADHPGDGRQKVPGGVDWGAGRSRSSTPRGGYLPPAHLRLKLRETSSPMYNTLSARRRWAPECELA